MNKCRLLFLLILICFCNAEVFSQQDFKKSILGRWKSDTIQNVSVQVKFKNSKGEFIWSNGQKDKFSYEIKNNIIVITREDRLSEHLISKLNDTVLELDTTKLTVRTEKTSEGREVTVEDIEFINELKFYKSSN